MTISLAMHFLPGLRSMCKVKPLTGDKHLHCDGSIFISCHSYTTCNCERK